MPTMNDSENLQQVFSKFSEDFNTLVSFHNNLLSSKGVDDQYKELLFETLFFRLFRLYENTIGDFFIQYSLMASKHPDQYTCYISPKDEVHAQKLLAGGLVQSDDTVRLDWAKPNQVKTKAEIFFSTENPIYIELGANSNSDIIKSAEVIRNYIAHNSPESRKRFTRVASSFIPSASPDSILSAGVFLMTTPKIGCPRNKEIFMFFANSIYNFFDDTKTFFDEQSEE